MKNHKKVLIVDDSLFMRKNLIKILKNFGFSEFLESEDGIQAVNEFEKHEDIDLITLDITMPGRDGIGALKEITKINNNVNILMVTALGRQDLIKTALELGAKGFILKPFKEEQIIETIKSLN